MKNSFSSIGIYSNLNYTINQKQNLNIFSPVFSDKQMIKLSYNTINTIHNCVPNKITYLYNYNSPKNFNKNIFNKKANSQEKNLSNKENNRIKTRNISLRKYNKNSDIQFMNLKIGIDITKNKINQLSDYIQKDVNKITNQKSFINIYNNQIQNLYSPKINNSSFQNNSTRNYYNLFNMNNNYYSNPSNQSHNPQRLTKSQNHENPINNKFNVNNYYISKCLSMIKNSRFNEQNNRQKSSEELSLLANDIISSFKITKKNDNKLKENNKAKNINTQDLEEEEKIILNNNYSNNNRNNMNNKNINKKNNNLSNQEININTNTINNNKDINKTVKNTNQEINININNREKFNKINNEINNNKNQESYIEIPQIEEPFSTYEYFQDTIDSKDSMKKKNIFLENNNISNNINTINTINTISNNSNNNNCLQTIRTNEISDLTLKTEESQFLTGRKKTEDNINNILNENQFKNDNNLSFNNKNIIEIKDNFTQTENFHDDINNVKYELINNFDKENSSDEEDKIFNEIIEKSKELEKLIISNKNLCKLKKKKNIIYFPNKNKKGMKPNFLSYHKKNSENQYLTSNINEYKKNEIGYNKNNLNKIYSKSIDCSSIRNTFNQNKKK